MRKEIAALVYEEDKKDRVIWILSGSVLALAFVITGLVIFDTGVLQ